jgi:hypothetical protein
MQKLKGALFVVALIGSAVIGTTWAHVRPSCIVAKPGATIAIPGNAPAVVQPDTCYWLEVHNGWTELLARTQ